MAEGIVRDIKERFGLASPKELKVGENYRIVKPLTDIRFGFLDEKGNPFPIYSKDWDIQLGLSKQKDEDQKRMREVEMVRKVQRDTSMDSRRREEMANFSATHKSQSGSVPTQIELQPGTIINVVKIQKFEEFEREPGVVPKVAFKIVDFDPDSTRIQLGGEGSDGYQIHPFSDIQNIDGQAPEDYVKTQVFVLSPSSEVLASVKKSR